MLAWVRREFAVCQRTQRDRQHIDMPTSGTPTLPYTAKQREEIVDILERNKRVLPLVYFARPSVNWHIADHAHSPCIILYVARLWKIIGKFYASTKLRVPLSLLDTENHRLEFGEEHPRLSFSQSSLEIPDGRWRLLFAVLSNTLLLGFPDGQQRRLKSLWLDQLVNTCRWREHISEMVEDLKQTMSWVC